MNKVIYIGVDPGKKGFITLMNEATALSNKIFTFIPMPECKVLTGEVSKTGKPKTKTVFYEEGLRDIVFKIKNDFPGFTFKVAIEDVIGRGGWSATNNFNFGYVAGLQKMIFIMLGAEITMVRPQKWQSYMRQGYENITKSSSTGKTQINDAKAMAEYIVKEEYPLIDFKKTKRADNNDHNKIDSFLMANYLFRINN